MINIKRNIRFLYSINLAEGEGLGTAYEYYVKNKVLTRLLRNIGVPKRILIAGLPEKYGLSMDLFLLGQLLHAEIITIDERSEALERAAKTLSVLKSRKVFNDINVSFVQTDNLAELSGTSFEPKRFDLVFSCEVLQRLKGSQGAYISNLLRLTKGLALFAPNQGNESHSQISGLKGVYLNDLVQLCTEGQCGIDLYDFGYMDMPPFPPGISRSQEKRSRAEESRFEALCMKGLEIYSLVESVSPKFLKEKLAHIVYAIVIRKDH